MFFGLLLLLDELSTAVARARGAEVDIALNEG